MIKDGVCLPRRVAGRARGQGTAGKVSANTETLGARIPPRRSNRDARLHDFGGNAAADKLHGFCRALPVISPSFHAS